MNSDAAARSDLPHHTENSDVENSESHSTVDIGAYASHFGWKNKARRLGWSVAWTLLVRSSPRPFFGWRRLVLRAFGARMAQRANVYPTTKIWAPWNLEMGEFSCLGPDVDCYTMARITIGAHATVSQYAFLCTGTHDIADPHMKLQSRPIEIGEGAWVCAGAFVGPGVTVGEGAVVGARAVVVKSVDAWAVVGGNPARFLKKRMLRTDDAYSSRDEL